MDYHWIAKLSFYEGNYSISRRARGIRMRAIASDTPFARNAAKLQKEYMREIRIVADPSCTFSPSIYLYDDNMAIMSYEEQFGFTVQSKKIVEALKRMWDLAWESSRLK